MKRLLLTLSLIWLLSACGTDGQSSSSEAKLRSLTLEPTPTLIPGLPTSTPWTDQPEGNGTSNVLVEDPVQIIPATAAPTIALTPTPVLLPAEMVVQGEMYMAQQNFDRATELFRSGLQSDLDAPDRLRALEGLGRANLKLEQYTAAAETFGELLAFTSVRDTSANSGADATGVENLVSQGNSDPYFLLAQAHRLSGNCGAAIGAYEAYLATNQELSPYVQPLIADCHLESGDWASAIDAFESALEINALTSTEIDTRLRLAQLYVDNGDYASAQIQYEAILKLDESEEINGKTSYLAGYNQSLAGNPEMAFDHYLQTVNDFPRAYESYLSLLALVDAEQVVDDFQRGLVDYYASAYEPAEETFNRYISANPIHREDVHLYNAWSYERLGKIEEALTEIDIYLESFEDQSSAEDSSTAGGEEPADGPIIDEPIDDDQNKLTLPKGWIEKGKMLVRAGMLPEAIDTYLAYLELFPDGDQAPFAAWWSAAFAERAGQTEEAISRYVSLADAYPDHIDAAESLFRAGYLSWQKGRDEEAKGYWQRAADEQGERDFGAASAVWLSRMLDEEESASILAPYIDESSAEYYALRAWHVASSTLPFEPAKAVTISGDTLERQEAESWLAEMLALESSAGMGELSEELVSDGRLIRGQLLWNLGLELEARNELEQLRRSFSDDALSSYQLALLFQDMGLYRSSILAADSLLKTLKTPILEAPKFIARLVYPVYYDELILEQAEIYDLDPLLLFALIRQESLFEAIATSGAAAMGLSQVIPDTGEYIANRLGWIDFEVEDLYFPYVGIAFGAYYLDLQLDTFDMETAIALSAYNGGPGNAIRWYEQAGADLDQYLETVDFAETRSYIQRIYVGHTIYKFLFGE